MRERPIWRGPAAAAFERARIDVERVFAPYQQVKQRSCPCCAETDAERESALINHRDFEDYLEEMTLILRNVDALRHLVPAIIGTWSTVGTAETQHFFKRIGRQAQGRWPAEELDVLGAWLSTAWDAVLSDVHAGLHWCDEDLLVSAQAMGPGWVTRFMDRVPGEASWRFIEQFSWTLTYHCWSFQNPPIVLRHAAADDEELFRWLSENAVRLEERALLVADLHPSPIAGLEDAERTMDALAWLGRPRHDE